MHWVSSLFTQKHLFLICPTSLKLERGISQTAKLRTKQQNMIGKAAIKGAFWSNF